MSGGKGSSESAPMKLDPLFKKYMGDLFKQSQPALGEASQIAGGMQPEAQAAWQSLLTPGVNPQLGAYQADVQRNLERNIMPTIQQAGVTSGGLGGSRTAMAFGQAGAEANRDITDMASRLYGMDRQNMLEALGLASGVATLGQAPYLTQAGIMGSPVTVGGGGKSKNKSLGL